MSSLQMPMLPTGAEVEGDLVRRAISGDVQAVREIIRTHNQRLYRLVRAVIRSNADAEDVLQEAYLNAFSNLSRFAGDASLSTWLSRIALNAALARLRAQKRLKRAAPTRASAEADIVPFPGSFATADPERIMAQRQLLSMVEEATDALPETFRLVFVARVIEGLSVEETASLLDMPIATVKSRLHRARRMIRTRLEERIGPVMTDAFPFAGTRCDRLTETVIARLGLSK
ncbi:RNA polymerase sigma factor [Ciceribacter azotifigens]|uniref:RNA polymerase sigma factor n=1 Tax=Ciceribacter azotifigens TaxID=2069303 RepID=UPI003A886AFD